jgi:hypothetical protein
MTTEVSISPGRKPILNLDFDGVCHLYTSGWKGAANIPDAPTEGMWEALRSYQAIFEVDIFSSRSNQEGGIEAMKNWFYRNLPSDEYLSVVEALVFPVDKPPAFIGIDDRVVTFRGAWPDAQELRAFKTWTQNPLGATNNHPRGKLNESDEGELRLAVFEKDGTVVIDFGKPTAWIGLDAETARSFANLIVKYANNL